MSYNTATLIGRLGRDPDIRYTKDQQPIATLSLATTDVYTDKTSGQRKERTEWHRVVLFGKSTGTARDHLKKGSLVLLEGALRTRKWQDPSGQDRFTTEIHARTLKMLGGKPESSSELPASSAATSSVAKEMPPIYQEPSYEGLGDYAEAETGGLRLSRYRQQGSIDYKAALLALVPDVDPLFLESFRRDSSERMRLTLKNEQTAQVPFSMESLLSANPHDGWF